MFDPTQQIIKPKMVACGCKAEPTILKLKSSIACSNNGNNNLKPKGHVKGTNKRLVISRNDPNFFKRSSSVRNMEYLNSKHPNLIPDNILRGRLVQHSLVFQQELVVRSFDIGFDGKMSVVALAKYLQETSLNHCQSINLLGDGFCTPKMSKNDLLWVLHNMHITVNHYPSWQDIIQVNTWIYQSGKNAVGVDWIFFDLKTGNTLVLASSSYVMMNKKTRKLSKFIEEVRMELKPFLRPNCHPVIKNNGTKLQRLDGDVADFIRIGLTPGWNDLDVNQHGNNAKFVEWILEGTPPWIMGSHQLQCIKLEFRKECEMHATLKCFSKYVSDENDEGFIELHHSLRLHSGSEVGRGRTMWRPKQTDETQMWC